MNGGTRVAAALVARGVRDIFTLCGGHISPILVEAKRAGIRITDVRHEVTAVFAADATARLTGVPGVAAVTAGPGLTNTITAVKNAQLAQSPVLVLGGATATALKGRGALQDIDQMALMRPHVKWARAVRRVRDLEPAVTEALRVATAGVPGPVFVECPVDLLYDEPVVREWYGASTPGGRTLAERATKWYLRRHVRRVFAPGGGSPAARPEPAAPTPGGRAVARAADALGRAERPVVICGSQSIVRADAAADVAAALERLGAPVYLSGMARGLLGRDHPLHIRHRRREALKAADVVVLAGVPCDFRLDYGRAIRRGCTVIAANRSRRDRLLNRRPTIADDGDAGLFLAGLAGAVGAPGAAWSSWLDALRTRDEEREREIAGRSGPAAAGVNPLALCRAIDAVLPDDSIVVADGGDFVGTASYIVRPRGPLCWLDPGVFGTLGVGAGFALGAARARPDAAVWLLYGDGSLGYSLAEVDTFVRHGIPVVAVVGNDACWAQIAREQVKLLGDDVGVRLARTDYHDSAAGLGATGLVIRSHAEIESTLAAAREAQRAGHAVLVNAHLAETDFREGSISI